MNFRKFVFFKELPVDVWQISKTESVSVQFQRERLRDNMEDHGKPRAITGDDGRLRETLIYRRAYVEVKHCLDNQKTMWMDDNGVRMHTHMHTWQHVDMHIRNTCKA